MKHARLSPVVVACWLSASSACSTTPTPTDDVAPESYDVSTVVEALSTSNSYSVLAAPPLPRAVPTTAFDPDSDIADADGSTVVTAHDGILRFVSGAARSPWFDVGLGSELRAVSGDGEHAALFQRSGGWSLITVVSASETGEDRSEYRLPGLVEPEAFSTDGSTLFVIDHQVAQSEGAYRVRPLDLSTGSLETILGPTKVPFEDDMNGLGRRQVWSPDGTRLYTLYVRQTHHHHEADGEERGNAASHGGHGEAGTDGFVHVLDLEEEWAFCLDLPADFGGGSLDTTALAISPIGDTLAVADLSAGQIAFADTDALEVTRTAPLPEVRAAANLQIAMTVDSIVLGSGRQLQWYDQTTLNELSPTSTQLEAPLTALTSNTAQVLAWTSDVTSGPTILTQPG